MPGWRPDPKGEYQELVDEISELLGAPATLENRDFELIAFGAYDSEGELDASALDPVRARSILTRRSTSAVRTWFEGFGIARATAPVRIPPTPEAGRLPGPRLPPRTPSGCRPRVRMAAGRTIRVPPTSSSPRRWR